MTEGRRVAIYARVSTRDQDCKRQVADLTAWAERAGFIVVEHLSEKGSGAKTDRALRARAIQAVKAGRYSAILVTEPSRWSRSMIDLIETLQELGTYGGSLLCLNGLSMDMSTPTGKLIVSIMGSMAEFERDLIRDRVVSGMEAAKRRGVKFGRVKGSKNVTYKHDDTILRFLASGFSVAQTAKTIGVAIGTVNAARNRAQANSPSG